MEIRLKRIADNGDASISLFYIDDVFQCFVIEDEHRTKKVYGETRIPKGVYEIGLRSEGGFHSRYSKKFSDHKGLLLNDVVDASKFTGSYSTQAYKRIYPKIANYIEECGPVQIIVE